MNDLMKAAAKVVQAAMETVSEASRSSLDTDAHIPESVFDRLTDAVNEWDIAVTNESTALDKVITTEQDWWNWLTGEDEHADDAQDMEDTEASFGADCKRDILRGCGR